MKQMDSQGLKMCSYQAALFENSLEQTQCSSPIFIRRFMNSDLAKRMDNAGFLYDATDVSEAINELETQYGQSSYGIEKYSREEMHWIGYIYRYWAYVSEKPSKLIYKTIKPGQLRKLFFPYHSLDPLQAIERIMEITKPEETYDPTDISAGVRVLRTIRNKSTHNNTNVIPVA